MPRTAGRRNARSQMTLWQHTDAGIAACQVARAEAQRKANETGLDHGLECNNVFKEWRSWTLPRREHRSGHELVCEVVMPEQLERCRSGHGPWLVERATR